MPFYYWSYFAHPTKMVWRKCKEEMQEIRLFSKQLAVERLTAWMWAALPRNILFENVECGGWCQSPGGRLPCCALAKLCWPLGCVTTALNAVVSPHRDDTRAIYLAVSFVDTRHMCNESTVGVYLEYSFWMSVLVNLRKYYWFMIVQNALQKLKQEFSNIRTRVWICCSCFSSLDWAEIGMVTSASCLVADRW